ncbi:MAG: serine/threonine protein kinase bacterial, partial [bacterium]
LTEVGEIFGTPHFMSPEQVMGHAVGAPADIYGAGVILYQMITGKTPLESSDVRNLLIAKISQDITPPSKVFSFINQAYDNIFTTVLARDPNDRYKSAGEFYEAFQLAIDIVENGLSVPEPAVTPKLEKDTKTVTVEEKTSTARPTKSTETIITPMKSSKSTMLVIVGIVVLVVVIVVIALVMR